jgi:hypothetical protein
MSRRRKTLKQFAGGVYGRIAGRRLLGHIVAPNDANCRGATRGQDTKRKFMHAKVTPAAIWRVTTRS